jgi:hypothetical protein
VEGAREVVRADARADVTVGVTADAIAVLPAVVAQLHPRVVLLANTLHAKTAIVARDLTSVVTAGIVTVLAAQTIVTVMSRMYAIATRIQSASVTAKASARTATRTATNTRVWTAPTTKTCTATHDSFRTRRSSASSRRPRHRRVDRFLIVSQQQPW